MNQVAAKKSLEEHALWLGLAGAGALISLMGGALIAREVSRRHKRMPAAGTYESIRSEGVDLVEGTTVRLTLDSNWMDVYAGGNDMTGTTMTVGPKLFWSETDSTGVGVMPRLAMQDAWLSRWLNKGVTFYRDHKRLILSDNEKKIVFQKIDVIE